MFNDKTPAQRNRIEGAVHSGQGTLRLERDGGLLPQLERAFAGTGPRQVVHGPRQTKPGTVTFAANRGGRPGGGMERRRGLGFVGTIGRRLISLPVAIAASIYQLPARMIISAIKESGGYVQVPWAAAVTMLGSAESGPAKTAANALGWALLVPALAVTVLINIPIAVVNVLRHPVKTIGGFFIGIAKGIAGFAQDKATELGSVLSGDGPSYYNLAAQYYSESH